MRPYVLKHVPSKTLAVFRKIEKVVQEMPDIDLGSGKDGGGRKAILSCHMLARALERFFPVKCEDGYFGDCEHSWLLPETPGFIIDPYPIGVLEGPLLVELSLALPWPALYKKAELTGFEDEIFLERVDKVAEVISQTIENAS